MSDNNDIAIVICTYNGSDRLRPTLEHLAACERTASCECLLVDNNSTDGTAAIAESIWSCIAPNDFKLKVVNERQQGLAFARRRGVIEAQSKLLIFCDDDNLLNSDYLVTASNIMEDKSIGAVSGLATAVTSEAPPDWFYTFAEYFAVGLQVQDPKLANGGAVDISDMFERCPWGAGLVMRRSDAEVVFNAPTFPLLAGRNGSSLTSGDDYEICHLIAAAGKRLIIDGSLRLQHVIPLERMTLSYLSRLQDGFKQQADMLAAYSNVRRYFHIKDNGQTGMQVLKKIAKAALGKHGDRDRVFLALATGLMVMLTDMEKSALINARFVRKNISILELN